jgi:hypothetical protein
VRLVARFVVFVRLVGVAHLEGPPPALRRVFLASQAYSLIL